MIFNRLYIGEDNIIQWAGLHALDATTYINDALVTWSLFHEDDLDEPIALGTLTYVEDSNGTYQGVINEDVELIEDATYYVNVTAESDEMNGYRRLKCTAEYHTSR